MTIRRQVDVAAMNGRLTNLERCAEVAPEGTFDAAKAAAEALAESSNAIISMLREHGFKCFNDDRIREVEAMIYGLMVASNEDMASMFHSAEGFGEHVDGPAGERVMAGIIRDRDFLRSLGAEA